MIDSTKLKSEEISGKSCHLGPLFWFGMDLGVSVKFCGPIPGNSSFMII